jgi:NodT family efflux transporter outer membrane factor (OMF) lipoprotein
MTTRFLLAAATLALAGCAVGPNYKRPAVKTPEAHRGAPAGASTSSLADSQWTEVFQDDALRRLIREALENNLDLVMATERVEQARARYRITAADQLPEVNATGQVTLNRPSRMGSSVASSPKSLDSTYTQAGGALSWELDLWGRVRRLRESARAQYLATTEARNGVVVSLIGDVAGGYFTLRERDLELEIAKATRDVASRNLELIKVRHDQGAATGLAVYQAEQFLYTATAQIASAERDIGQAENLLSLLLGKPPANVERGKAVDDFALPTEIPAGLPSSLLERRPDIRAAEQLLVAANAQIGVAKAYYFPQISLTAFLGGQSRSLSNLFTGPARYWTATPSAVLPVFNANAVRMGVRLTEAQKREMIANYQKTVYNAFRETSDALIRYSRTREQRMQQDKLVRALTETDRLANIRYKGGLDSYLQVLDAERNLFQGRLTLAQLRLQELLSYVQLYRALGGGWR